MIIREPSCEDADEPALLPVIDARQRIAAALQPLTESRVLPLGEALGRVLAQPLHAPHDVPAAANSAMDGYALCRSSIPRRGEARLRLLGTAWAGRPFDGTVSQGDAVRIFTGGLMPSGADTVVIQEHAREDGDEVLIDDEVEAGRNVRAAGEDVVAGEEILSTGRCLEAADLGVLASLGIDRVTVLRRPRVAFFTTGDELHALEPGNDGAAAPHGKLFDSNRFTLAALLASAGVEAIDLGIVPDDAARTREVLLQAAARADVVLTSGGISAGDADYVTRAFHAIGDVSFWKIAMRPGRPLAFGYIDQAAFFGLPGNPVAVMVTFLQFVQPALRRLLGRADIEPLTLPARCLSSLRKSAGRVEFQRGVMRVEAGAIVVESTGKQGAGRLSSMSRANCLIVIDADADKVSPGDTVGVQPFKGLLPG